MGDLKILTRGNTALHREIATRGKFASKKKIRQNALEVWRNQPYQLPFEPGLTKVCMNFEASNYEFCGLLRIYELYIHT